MNYQPRSTNPYIMEKKLNECVGGGGLDPSVLVKRTMATVSLSDGGAGGTALTLFGIPLDSKVISLYVEHGNLSKIRSYTLNMFGDSGYLLNVYENGKPTTATSVTVSVFYIEP